MAAGALAIGGANGAEPLTEGTFTEVVRDVAVIDAQTQQAVSASRNGTVRAPNLVRTGPASRAELSSPDQSVTRIGANTVFSFVPSERELQLQKGSVLFHTPSGKGGLKVETSGASAAVLGTTIIIVATPNGGFKIIVLEGKARVFLPGMAARIVGAGQLAFVLPGQKRLGPVLTINLAKLVAGARLVHGFENGLPSMPAIEAAIAQQQQMLASGEATDTGEPADTAAGKPGNSVDDTHELIALNVRGFYGTPKKDASGQGGFIQPTPPPF